MKKIKKINLMKSDFVVLNSEGLQAIKGGERTLLGCVVGVKLYECVNIEGTCPNGFTTGECGGLNVICSKNYTTRTF